MVCSRKHHMRLRNNVTSDIFRVRQDATYVTWNLRSKFLLIISIINLYSPPSSAAVMEE